MPIWHMDILRLMSYVQQVEKQKLRDGEDFTNKKAKTGIESGQQKSSADRSSFQHKHKSYALSSVSAPKPKNKIDTVVGILKLNLLIIKVV